MILKLRIAGRPHAANGTGGWTYVDDVVRVDTHDVPVTEDGPRAFTREGLVQFVNESWGPSDLREFDFELWPQDMHDDWCRFAAVAVAYLASGGTVLVVMTEDCYLLGANGQNVDRLCASGMAFPR